MSLIGALVRRAQAREKPGTLQREGWGEKPRPFAPFCTSGLFAPAPFRTPHRHGAGAADNSGPARAVQEGPRLRTGL
jgi:hypothetical protein